MRYDYLLCNFQVRNKFYWHKNSSETKTFRAVDKFDSNNDLIYLYLNQSNINHCSMWQHLLVRIDKSFGLYQYKREFLFILAIVIIVFLRTYLKQPYVIIMQSEISTEQCYKTTWAHLIQRNIKTNISAQSFYNWNIVYLLKQTFYWFLV